MAIRARRISCALGLALLTVCRPGLGQAPQARARAVITLSLDANPIDITVEALQAAARSVDAVVYKFEEPRVLDALEDAVRRGVVVRVVADAEEAGTRKSLADRAQAAGIEVHDWVDGKLHAKFAVVDDTLMLTGSYNWTESASEKNIELIIGVEHQDVVARFSELFATLWDGSPPLTEERP